MKKVFSPKTFIPPISVLYLFLSASDVLAAVGHTTIAKWKEYKKGPFTLHFGDSTISQADIAIPSIFQRGLVATWYINRGKQ